MDAESEWWDHNMNGFTKTDLIQNSTISTRLLRQDTHFKQPISLRKSRMNSDMTVQTEVAL